MAVKTSPPKRPRRCPATQAVVYCDGLTTAGTRNSALPCLLVAGHEGHHVCYVDGKPYEFENKHAR